MKHQIVMEALAIGFLFGLLLFLWGSIIGVPNTASGLALVGFLIGVGTHLVAEQTDLNKWYCSNGVACRKKKNLSFLPSKHGHRPGQEIETDMEEERNDQG